MKEEKNILNSFSCETEDCDEVDDRIEEKDLSTITDINNFPNESMLYSKDYTKIFDTDYYWKVPYVMNVEKYKKVVPDTRLSDYSLRSVNISCKIEIDKSWNGIPENDFILFLFTNDYDKNRDNKPGMYYYDCLSYYYWNNEITVNGKKLENNFENFKERVREIVSCIEGIDEKRVREKCKEITIKKEQLDKQRLFLEDLI